MAPRTLSSTHLDENGSPQLRPVRNATALNKPSLSLGRRTPTFRPQASRASLGSIYLNGESPPRWSTNTRNPPKGVEKPSRTEEDHSEENKENIPPLRFVKFATPPRPRVGHTRTGNSHLFRLESAKTVGVHVLQIPGDEDLGDSDVEPEDDITKGSPRLTRSITPVYQDDGKVLLRFGRVVQLSPRETKGPISSDSDSDCGATDNSDSHSLLCEEDLDSDSADDLDVPDSDSDEDEDYDSGSDSDDTTDALGTNDA